MFLEHELRLTSGDQGGNPAIYRCFSEALHVWESLWMFATFDEKWNSTNESWIILGYLWVKSWSTPKGCKNLTDSMARWFECVDCHVLAILFTFIHIWIDGRVWKWSVCPWNGDSKRKTQVPRHQFFCHQHRSALSHVIILQRGESICPVRLVLDF